MKANYEIIANDICFKKMGKKLKTKNVGKGVNDQKKKYVEMDKIQEPLKWTKKNWISEKILQNKSWRHTCRPIIDDTSKKQFLYCGYVGYNVKSKTFARA